jgi:GTPase SAR1 family protein
MQERLRRSRLRVAVLGSVKSGKSTLVNALLGRDVLRRGAGILTSMITRIQYGASPQATLRFKSLETVEQEFQNALTRLFAEQTGSESLQRQLRVATDRAWLSQALKRPFDENLDLPHFAEHRSLLQALVRGFEEAEPYLSDEPSLLNLADTQLEAHQQWVEQDARAVFLEDVLLQLPEWRYSSTEIADCQGSDSPNPQHYAMVQEYAARSSVLIYVISSRVGVRQADVKLLRHLQQLGLAESVLFVINLDWNEHETEADAQRVVRQIEADLRQCGWSKPLTFTFSALRGLLDGKTEISEREKKLLSFWSDHALAATHEAEWQQFRDWLQETLERQQRTVLLRGEWRHWQRLQQQMLQFVWRLCRELAREDTSQESWTEAARRRRLLLRYHGRALRQAIQGGEAEWKRLIDRRVRSLFDKRDGIVWERLERFVEQLELSSPVGEEGLAVQGLLWMEETRQKLLQVITEEINVVLLPELGNLRTELTDSITQTTAPFFEALDEAEAHWRWGASAEDNDASPQPQWQFPDIAPISFTTTMAFRGPEQIRNWLAFGQSWIRSFFRSQRNFEEEYRKQSTIELQSRLRRALDFDVLNYQENLKYRYLWEGTRQLLREIEARWEESEAGCLNDLEAVLERVEKLSAQRQSLLPQLQEWCEVLESLSPPEAERSERVVASGG